MRSLFLILITLTLSLRLLPADGPTDPFYELSPLGFYKEGHLEIDPYPDSRLWLNGVRIATHSDDPGSLSLKPGDTLYQADFRAFIYRHHLNSLTPTEARFTRSTYTVIRVPLNSQSWRISSGKLQSQTTFTVDLTQTKGLLIDYGPNHVEVK